jgi:hypothetical protein
MLALLLSALLLLVSPAPHAGAQHHAGPNDTCPLNTVEPGCI